MVDAVRIAVVDDHPVVRKGVAQTICEESDFIIVGEGASADDAVRLAQQLKPDVLVLDVTMPGGGIDAIARIRAVHPTARIIMLSIREELSAVRASLKAGAQGYVSKGIDGDELIAAIRKILTGARYISPELAARLIAGDDEQSAAPTRSTPTELPELTAREREILDLLGKGLSNLEIASQIGLSENTIKHYLTPLMQKLGVRNRTEAALLARGVTGSSTDD